MGLEFLKRLMSSIVKRETGSTIKWRSLEQRAVNLELNEKTVMEYLGFTDKKDLDRLKDRIQGVQGCVRVFVHPLFSKGPDAGNSVHDAAYRAYEKNLASAYNSSKNSPLFLFEEPHVYNEIKQGGIFTELGVPLVANSSSIIILKTYDKSGVPFIAGSATNEMDLVNYLRPGGNLELYDDCVNKSFDFLAAIFKYLGIKNVIAGGMNISVGYRGFEQCLGCWVEEMRKRGFSVDVHPKSVDVGLTPPKTRESLQRSGAVLKQTGKKGRNNT